MNLFNIILNKCDIKELVMKKFFNKIAKRIVTKLIITKGPQPYV
jgi:hypothetical protein